jgi:cyclophilin family peptidyl-prolyl cis-trans isomerase
MKQILSLAMIVFSLILAGCGAEKHTYAEIETDYGTMKIMLYNTTPIHRDNFVKLAKDGYYDGLLFHRVINGFMIQGGDPDSKNAPFEQPLGGGGPGYELDPEIGAPHLKGALAAARTSNPQKRSSGSQFYIVQGQPVTDDFLNQMEMQKGIKYSEAQRQAYKELGGAPFLDNDYTVYGEVVEGYDVIDKIAGVQTGQGDRPAQDVRMKVRIIK